MKTLNQTLQEFRDALIERIPPAEADALRGGVAALCDPHPERQAKQQGEAAPDFTLPDQDGRPVRLATLLRQGPVVLNFYRGGWSPFCELTLRAFQAALPRLRQRGAAVLAVAPEPPAALARTARRHGIGFPLLSDADGAVAAAFGLRTTLPPELRQLFARFDPGLDPARCAGPMPMPAGYVIGRDGIIALAALNPCGMRRMEPADALSALARLAEPPLPAASPGTARAA